MLRKRYLVGILLLIGGFVVNDIKVCIDATPFVFGRAPGYNAYILNLINGLLSINQSKYKFYICIRVDQVSHFSNMADRAKFVLVPVKSVWSRVIWQNFVMPITVKADIFLHTGNFLPLLKPKNSILVLHDLNYIFHPDNFSVLSLLYRKLVIKYSIFFSDSLVSISKYVESTLIDNYKKASVVIHNPVAYEVSPAFDCPSVLSQVDFFVIPSSLAAHKNIPEMVKAIELYVKYYPSSRFVFFGNWSKSEFVWGSSCTQIEVLGFIDSDLKNKLYSSCNSVIVPSVFEGFGMPYVEAVYWGKCLICSDITVAREVVEDYPVYVTEPFLAEDIFNAMLNAKNKSFHVDRYSNLRFIDKFSPSKVALKYMKVFDDVIN